MFKVSRRDTLEDIEKNLKQMNEWGFNTVVVWPAAFWWEEKTENYPFNTGIELLKMAEKYGLKIIMELAGQLTTMEYIPDFLMKEEYHPVDINGNREFGQTTFGFLNYFHPEVKELITEHYKRVAKAYKDFDALIGYDVFNETMYRSFDKYTINDFREWLKEKYSNIDALNESWERTYSSFDQITYERWRWLSTMADVDYSIYRKDAIKRFLKPWCDAIKSVDDKHFLIADNVHSMVMPGALYDRPQDDFGLSEVSDKIGMSFYPKSIGGTMAPPLRWEIFDSYYTASGRKGFYISEMQTHIQAMFNPTTCVKPYEIKLWCAESYAAGAEAIIYWMWRSFEAGVQTLGRGLVNYQNKPTERLYIAKEINEKLLSKGVLSPVKGKVGILFNPICDDVIRGYTKSYGRIDDDIYLKSIYGCYKAFYDINVKCDIITVDEINNYGTVVLTNTVTFDKDISDAVLSYVKNGGRIIADGRFAVVDNFAKTLDVIPCGEYNSLVGEVYFDSDNDDATIKTSFGDIEGYCGRYICDVTAGEVLAEFTDGKAAIVKKKTGLGEVITLNSSVFYGYGSGNTTSAVNLAKHLASEYNLYQIKANTPLKIRLSERENDYCIFAFNYTEEKISSDITLTLGGNEVSVTAEVNANDVEIITVPKK